MRIYAESRSKRRFWCGRWADGIITIEEGDLGGAPAVVQTEACAEGDAQARLNALLSARFGDGFMAMTPPEDRWTAEPEIGAWFAAEGLVDTAPAAAPVDLVARFAEQHGRPLPPELARFLDWRGRNALGHVDFGEWRLDPGDAWCPDQADGNRFEQLILRDQENYLGTRMLEAFAGCVPLGQTGNGDVYFAHLDPFDPDRAEVVFWDHDRRGLDDAFADGISSLAWINRWYRAVEQGDFDPEALTTAMQRVADRAALTWHYGDLQSESGVEPAYARRTNALYYFYRTLWIIRLLQSDGVRGFREIGELFYEKVHAEQRFEAAVDGPYLRFGTVTGLYWLWRLFWFDKADDLTRCVRILENHPSPLMRDAAALVAELQAGRKTLGKIEDIHALRAKFIALDLDPDRAAARAAEAAAAEAAAAAKAAADRSRAMAAVQRHGPEAIAALAWREIDSPEALAIFLDALRPAHPETFARIDFLTERGSSRDNRSFGFENDEIFEHLPHTAPWLAPFWLADVVPGGLICAARTGDLRVRSHAEPILAERGEHHHRLVSAIEALTALNARDLVPRFEAMLPEFVWEGRDFIAAIRNKRVVWALCAAIGALGGPENASALVPLAADGPKEIAPRALKALAQLGGQVACDALIAALDGPYRRIAMFGLAHADPRRAREVLSAALAWEHGAPSALAYERLMLEYARRRCGEAPNDAIVDAAFATIEALQYEDIELHQTLAALAPEGSMLLAAQALHPRAPVREAAHAGLPDAVRYADRPTVDALFERAGLGGLTTWLCGTDVAFQYQLIRKAAEVGAVDDAFATAAVAWFERALGRFTAYTHGFVRDENRVVKYTLHALCDLGHPIVDALLERVIHGTNTMYSVILRKYDRDKRFAAAERPATDEMALEFDAFGDALWTYGGSINGLAWSPDGRRLAVAGSAGVALFDAGGRETVRCPSTRNGWIYDVEWHPSGAWVAMGAHAGHLFLLDPTDGSLITRLEGHSGVPKGVRKLRVSPDGTRLASVSCDRTLRVWDVSAVEAGAPVECVWVHRDTADVNGVDWIDDRRLVITTDNALRFMTVGETPYAAIHRCGGADVRVQGERVWVTAPDAIRAFDLSGEEDPAARLAQTDVARLFPFDGGLIAASWSGSDVGVSIWRDGARERLDGHAAAVFGLSVQPETGRISAGGKLNRVVCWSADGVLEGAARTAHGNEISDYAFADGLIYTASDDGTVIEWSASGEALRHFKPSTGGRCCAVAVQGDVLVTSGSAQVAAFDRSSGEELWAVTLGRSEVMEIFDDVVVAADYKGLVWLDLRTGARLHATEPFSQSFMFRLARLDATRFACAGYDDARLYVWDAAAREQVGVYALPPTAEKGKISGVARGGDRLFVTRWDKTLVVLDAATGALQARVHLPYSGHNPAADATGDRLVLGEARCLVYSMSDYAQVGAFTPPGKLSRSAFAPDGALMLGAASGTLHRARLPDA